MNLASILHLQVCKLLLELLDLSLMECINTVQRTCTRTGLTSYLVFNSL